MQIKRSELYKKQFRQIIFHIAKDKKEAAKKFKKELNKSIENLIIFPYKYKISFYYEEQNIRDMTFKSYSIIYKLNEKEECIEILEIFNKNLPIIKEDI